MINEIIYKNGAYFDALIKDLEQAKISIDLSTYIYKEDILGVKIAKALIDAAKRGVRVRLLIDGVGGRFVTAPYVQFLRKEGVIVRIFHPLPWTFWQWGITFNIRKSFIQKFFYFLSKLNTRNHQKTCIIDDEIIYVSSANVDGRHLPLLENGAGWRDTSIRITGISTERFHQAFNYAWHYYYYLLKIKRLRRIEFKNKNDICIFKFTKYGRRVYHKNLLLNFANSKKRIWIVSPYFAPDNKILDALKSAANRGVNVKILLPQISDFYITTLVTNTFYSDLLKDNVLIYEYINSILHAKILIIDDLFYIGSTNFNTRSLQHDLELDVKVSTDAAKEILTEQFYQDLSNSRQIKPDDLQKLTRFKHMLGKLLLMVRYFM